MPTDLTVLQATELAKYFIGPEWFALAVSTRGGRVKRMLTSDGKGSFVADNWREVFRAAGVTLPVRSEYVAINFAVMKGDQAICEAKSNTMAKRIAAALNKHSPDRRGI